MPNPPSRKADISISLIESKCLHFVLTDYGQSNRLKVPDNHYEFSLSISLTPIENIKQIGITINSQLFEKKTDQLKLELAAIEVSNSFFIQNFTELIARNQVGDLIVPDSLIKLCNSVTIGVARGMFALKLENTPYANALLPLLDERLVKTITSIN